MKVSIVLAPYATISISQWWIQEITIVSAETPFERAQTPN